MNVVRMRDTRISIYNFLLLNEMIETTTTIEHVVNEQKSMTE